MTEKSLHLRIPPGVREFLPEEAARKRKLENSLVDIFEKWGYREVITPTFEYYDALAPGSSDDDTLYKFLDRQGKILALRPDMTTPIARLVATRLKDKPLPLKLFYIANVFSYEDPQIGRQREFYQAGIELLGYPDAKADAEVIAIAAECFKGAGLEKFQLTLGQIDVFNGLMEEFNFSEELQKRIKNAINNKDFVTLEEIIQQQDISSDARDRFIKLITLRGGLEIIGQGKKLTGNSKTVKALDNLAEVYHILENYNVTEHISLDLGLLRGLDYYTGVVFEGYTANLGYSICGGGRYDRLLGKFGYDCPATGFAMGIERILLAQEKL